MTRPRRSGHRSGGNGKATYIKMRPLILERSNYLCDLCGGPVRPDEYECHHRLMRSQMGRHTWDNLIVLHGGFSALSCHRKVHDNPQWAYMTGFLVPSFADPGAWPVLRHFSYWEQPTADGWIPAEPMEGQNEGDPGMPPRAAWLKRSSS